MVMPFLVLCFSDIVVNPPSTRFQRREEGLGRTRDRMRENTDDRDE
jgi:hypothetical protein